MVRMRQLLGRVRPWRLALAIVLIVVLAAGFGAGYAQYGAAMRRYEGDYLTHAQDGSIKWTYYMGGARGTPIKTGIIYNEYGYYEAMEHPITEGQAVGYSCVLTSTVENAKLSLRGGMGPIVVFLDDDVLYTDLPGQPAAPDHWPQLAPGLYEEYRYGSSRLITISMPPNYTGRTLTIVEYPTAEALPTWDPMIPTIENEYADRMMYMTAYAPTFIEAGLLAAGLLLLALLFCYQLLTGKPNWPVLLPMAFLAIWAISFSQLPDDFGIRNAWEMIIFSLAYVAADDLLLAYLACKMKGRARFALLALAVGHFCLAVGLAIWRWVAWQDFAYTVSRTEWYLGLPQLAGFAVAAVLAFREWKRGNRVFGVYCRLLIAFACFVAVAVPVAWLALPEQWDYFTGLYSSAFEYANFAPLLEALSIFMIISILVISLYEFIAQQIEKNTTLQTMELKNRLALENYEAIQAAIRQTNLAQHELRNHTIALQALLDGQEYERAGEYLRRWTRQSSELAPVRYGENQLVSAIVQNRVEVAAGMGIRTDCEVVVPAQLPVPDAELCSLLLNMLDNAIEANARLPREKRWLRLRINGQDGMLAVSCRNAWDGSLKTAPDGGLSSTKADGAAPHGYGIAAMRAVAEDYGSLLDISHDEEAFTVRTCLQLPA